MSSRIGNTTTRGQKSPRSCELCGKMNFNLFRYGSTGITFSKCTECGRRTVKQVNPIRKVEPIDSFLQNEQN